MTRARSLTRNTRKLTTQPTSTNATLAHASNKEDADKSKDNAGRGEVEFTPEVQLIMRITTQTHTPM